MHHWQLLLAEGSAREGVHDVASGTWDETYKSSTAFSRVTASPPQAVMYFRRAIKLDQACLSAWTLMGHEYVEMKNPPAAIGVLL